MPWLTRLLALLVAALAVAFAVAWFTAAPAVMLKAKPKPAALQTQPTLQPQSEPLGLWKLSGTPGTPDTPGTPVTSAPDNAPGEHPVTGTGVTWCPGGGCAAFSGTDSALATSAPVLDTGEGHSFTVSAQVNLRSLPPAGVYATAVSQDGAITPDGNSLSGFFLQYDGADQSWSFSLGPGKAKTNPGTATAGTWVDLTGVYDGSGNSATLYVDGKLAGADPGASPFASNGPLVIGRAQFQGRPSDWWPGEIKNVEVFGQALTPAEVQALQSRNNS